MTVFIVLRNDKIETVFTTRESAESHIKAVGGWNTWQIIEKDVHEW